MSISEAVARQNLSELLDSYYNLVHSTELELASESDVLVYIERLFRDVLGWPTEDVSRFQREKRVVNRKRVDRVLHLENGETIFIEAKRFGAIARLSDEWALKPGQLSLPGMATDRTKDEQQAINYAFQNDGTWAILTNFQIFRLYNARRDWLVFTFEAPRAYEVDFDLLWQLSWDNLNSGSLDTLNSQRWTREVDTDYLQFISEQREQLAIDITHNPEKNQWAYTADGKLRLRLVREVVQRFLDRLVIVRFAEDHFVIPSHTLQRFYDLRKSSPYYTQDLQHYLHDFFQHFDREHNSALFAPGEVDKAHFSDAVLLPLIEKLYGARYRAMPADVIGNTYEQYLGNTLVEVDGAVETRVNLETRKRQGSYYTPAHIVEFIVDRTLGSFLYGTENGKPDGAPLSGAERKTSKDIRNLRVLDSACGSGSFLIYAFEALAEFYRAEVTRLSEQYADLVKRLAASNGEIPLEAHVEAQRIANERDFLRGNYRNLILERHLYGVDFDPQAAEIAVVNLMMRAMVRKGKVARLPLMLNQNIKVGNSLIGLPADDARWGQHENSLATLRQLREELTATSHLDARHNEILSSLSAESQRLYERFDEEFSNQGLTSEQSQPFHWMVEFPEAFVDASGKPLPDPGFDVIFGNPPYSAKLSAAERKYFRGEFKLGMTNTAGLFMAQALRLLAKGRGRHGLIVPKSFLYASNWRRLRESLLEGLEHLVDCGRAWSEVLLEQATYVYNYARSADTYQNYLLEDEIIELIGTLPKPACLEFGLYLNGVHATDLEIGYRMQRPGIALGKFISVRAGADLQKAVVAGKQGFRLLGGINVQRYTLREQRGYFDSDELPRKARVNEGDILAQDILAFIENPMPHVKITAHKVLADEINIGILNTINKLAITSGEIDPNVILALLNSKLINWYVYRFIFAKPIRTMHFNRPIISRIPLPDLESHPLLIADITAEVDKIYANRHASLATSQQRIDELVFQLYGLSDEQIAHVKANMP
ncbi:MAG: N-6 DNA methylase [Chloroflexi bacterium]|nr:N-6 DNA methylase [Chloroflexota bacterium]